MTSAPVIRLRGVRKHYQVGGTIVKALDGVDMEVHANEYVAIMGASGSGKSTLLNMLSCLDRPTEGSYELAGRSVADLGTYEMAEVRNRHIGIVFQSFELLAKLSAQRNVELPLIYRNLSGFERRQRASGMLTRLGLGDRGHHRPNQLSGGQRQRVAIARALVGEPTILLADEPTGNLDSTTTGEILDLIDGLHADGQTVILITHEEDVARRAKRLIRLHDGLITEDRPVRREVHS